MGDDEIGFRADQFTRQLGQSLVATLRPAILDQEVAPLLVASLAQAFAQCLDVVRHIGWPSDAEETNAPDLSWLLRVRG